MLNELFILSKIKEGDIKAFEEVFHRYYSPLCWYAAGIIGQMEVAEEIVEELFYVFGGREKTCRSFALLKAICMEQCAMRFFNIVNIGR